ncbi:MAG: superoxide dismutase [Flavobacteriales bacterium]|nr:superoxide dismutase [Flavobacteriales bacterium]
MNKNVKELLIPEFFKTPILDYEPSDLSPTLSEESVRSHLGHHESIVMWLNERISGTELENASIQELCKEGFQYDQDLAYYAGGHYNHTLFWTSLRASKNEAAKYPSHEFLKMIVGVFGSLETLIDGMALQASTSPNATWVWLTMDRGILEIKTTEQNHNPCMNSAHDIPLLCIDMSEHAYFMDYGFEKRKYLKAILHQINWKKVSERFNINLKK